MKNLLLCAFTLAALSTGANAFVCPNASGGNNAELHSEVLAHKAEFLAKGQRSFDVTVGGQKYNLSIKHDVTPEEWDDLTKGKTDFSTAKAELIKDKCVVEVRKKGSSTHEWKFNLDPIK